MSEIEIKHVMARDKKTDTSTGKGGQDKGHNTLPDQTDTLKNDGNQMQSEESRQKFKILMEWKRRCKEPTAENLHQNLWRAGYGERTFLHIFKLNTTKRAPPEDSRKYSHASQRNFLDLTDVGLEEVDELQKEGQTHGIALGKNILKSIIVSHSEPSLRTKTGSLSSEETSLSSFSGQSKGRRKTVAFNLTLDNEDQEDMIEVMDASTQTDFTVDGHQCNNVNKVHKHPFTLTQQRKSQDPSNVKFVTSKTIQLCRTTREEQFNRNTNQISRNKFGREVRGHSQEWRSFFEIGD